MERQIATFAGLASFGMFVALAIAEVQEWKMPEPLAISLISLMGLLAFLAIGVVFHGVWVISTPYRRGWTLRTPIYNITRQQPVSPSNTETEIQPAKASLEKISFLLKSRIELVNFAGLWNSSGQPSDEPAIEFIIELKNDTILSVLINGIVGEIKINGDTCRLPNKLETGSRFPPSHHFNAMRVTQPLLTDRGMSILQQIGAGETVSFDLTGLRWQGVVETLNVDLPSLQVVAETFDANTDGVRQEQPHVSRKGVTLTLY